jgi:hypothetical protein
MKRFIIAAAATAAAALATTPASAAVNFAGSTGGCFAPTNPPNCTPTGGSGAAASPGLTYTAGSFALATSDIDNSLSLGGSSNDLGYFTLTGATGNYNGTLFNLLITFTLPLGTTPNPATLTATLVGSVTSSSNGGVTVDFVNNLGNPLVFNSGAGQFYLTVTDTSVSPTSTNAFINGRIVMAAVPEPATWAMMLLGFGGIGFAMRRRRQPTLAQVA